MATEGHVTPVVPSRLVLALDRMIESVEADIKAEPPGNYATIGALAGELKGLKAARLYADLDDKRGCARSESERSVLVKKVEAFATLPDNWDSYGSKKFPPRTILLAREIAAKLGPEWSAVPCADGPSVWLTRDNENDIIEVRTSDDD